MATPADDNDSRTSEVEEVSDTVKVLKETLEVMKKEKKGFYAPKGSFPIKESVKKAIMDKYPHPEQAVYKLLEKLHNFDFMEIREKTEKEAKREAS
ncbi:hypothetical protein DAPPUDRAFT_250275 [Daphnia pulex]|uniref:Uncharacterized protein n=1 Tax=Daphnia pulex TaxID=6669 RepID=E9GY83_DAPPU|nr:hypothetical protein DAPPUDRAFT_250275 [Daphnia pulex]|eukprot:EFX75608.1 hypothetical protein DAPPUDRAFT_250275 [Daphnia pulex]